LHFGDVVRTSLDWTGNVSRFVNRLYPGREWRSGRGGSREGREGA
jgi:hypothetical protein